MGDVVNLVSTLDCLEICYCCQTQSFIHRLLHLFTKRVARESFSVFQSFLQISPISASVLFAVVDCYSSLFSAYLVAAGCFLCSNFICRGCIWFLEMDGLCSSLSLLPRQRVSAFSLWKAVGRSFLSVLQMADFHFV